MKTMSNILNHKNENDGDGSSSAVVTENINAVRDVSARRTAVVMVVIHRRVCRIESS